MDFRFQLTVNKYHLCKIFCRTNVLPLWFLRVRSPDVFDHVRLVFGAAERTVRTRVPVLHFRMFFVQVFNGHIKHLVFIPWKIYTIGTALVYCCLSLDRYINPQDGWLILLFLLPPISETFLLLHVLKIVELNLTTGFALVQDLFHIFVHYQVWWKWLFVLLPATRGHVMFTSG